MRIRMVEAEDLKSKIDKVADEAEDNGATPEQADKYEKDIEEAAVDLSLVVGDAVVDTETEEGMLEQILTDALHTAIRNKKYGEESNANVLLVGPGGVGKTSRSRQWAKDHKVNFVEVDAKVLDASDIGGIVAKDKNDENVAIKLANTQFDALDSPGSVLFLDEYNRADDEVRGSLLELVQSHQVNDNREATKKRELKGFLFTIAAINPPNKNYNTNMLDQAERSRYRIVTIQGDPKETARHFEKVFQKKIDACVKNGDKEEELVWRNVQAMAKQIFESEKFHFSTEKEENDARDKQWPVTNSRSLMNLMNSLRTGTKEELLAKWDSFCYPDQQETIEDILASYVDIEDEANDAFNVDADADFMSDISDDDLKHIKSRNGRRDALRGALHI